jgi:photosystem II stability/assembly factor-like uncharacterized protein
LKKIFQHILSVASILLFVVMFSTCKKQTIELSYRSFDLPVNDFVNSIRFKNDSTWYVAAGRIGKKGYILKTVDAGNSWKFIFDNSAVQDIYDLLFLNDSTIMAGSDYLDYYYTTDYGKNWKFEYYTPWMLEEVGLPIEKFYHVNDSIVFILGGFGYGHGMVVRSVDKGKNWVQTDYNQEMQGIHFIGKTGYVCGHGIVLKSNDFGERFDTLQIKDENFVAVAALSESRVVLVSNSGKIFVSTDGGDNWKKVYQKKILGNLTSLRDMIFLDGKTGFAVGVNGFVIKSTDSGETWARITGLPNVNFKRIFYTPGHRVFITGEKGTLIELLQ